MAQVARKKSNKGGIAIYLILFVLLLALNGVLNFIVASFTLTTLLSASYWLKTIAGASSGLGAFIIFSFMRRDSLTLNQETYNAELDELNNIVSESVDDDFPLFIAQDNREMKKTAWTTKWQNKKLKWTKKVKASVLRDIKIIKEDKWNFNIPKWRLFKRWLVHKRRKKALKWIAKLDNIEEKLSPKWIEENIDYRKVSYPDVTPAEILTGERNNSVKRIIDNNAFRHIFRDRLPLILLTTTLQALYHALNIIQAVNPASVIAGVIVQLATLFINAAVGFNYGTTLFKKLDRTNLFTRRNYIMRYLKWKERPKTNEKNTI